MLSRREAGRRSPIGAGARVRRPADPQDARERMRRRPRSRSSSLASAPRTPPCPCTSCPMSPRRSHRPARNCPALCCQLSQDAADGVLGVRGHLTAARTKERSFASQINAGGPIWPHGTPRPCRPSNSQILETCVNAANYWIPASGRSRTRTWSWARETAARSQTRGVYVSQGARDVRHPPATRGGAHQPGALQCPSSVPRIWRERHAVGVRSS
jgi:hypothetical protein